MKKALVDEPPLLARDGGFIAPGYKPELDEIIDLRDSARDRIKALQEAYIQETGVSSLKIKHNHVLGYYVEVTALNAKKLSDVFIHRQTMVNAQRFTTVSLSELEAKIQSAADQALTLELDIFQDLIRHVLGKAGAIIRTARALAEIDVASTLGYLADSRGYNRPQVDDSKAFLIEGGRHPVVEEVLKSQGKHYEPNDCNLTAVQRIWLLTGPNMAGKSTYLRQNALLTVLTQMGSFVPATKAHIGRVDRLFSRVGAADDLAKGQSTFMVEMIETATILNQATERSLVILDEVGRGTATYDGVAIAWATVEHLHDKNRCRALFATHYHELTDLKEKLEALVCRTMKIKEWNGQVIFLHKVIEGTADRSYGIHVAQLAGVPPSVITRAEKILHTLEERNTPNTQAKTLPLFAISQDEKAAPMPEPVTPLSHSAPSPLLETLRSLDIDALSPREALEILYKLKEIDNTRSGEE